MTLLRPTLLLADDSVTIQRVIELTFAHENVRVVALSDGEQAIRRIDLERPDIVLADVGMPRVDGYAVSAHVKASPALANIPVLLLTGAFEPIDDEKVRASGCDGVLVKPFEPQQLVVRVRDLLAKHRPLVADAPTSAPSPFARPMASVLAATPSAVEGDFVGLDAALGTPGAAPHLVSEIDAPGRLESATTAPGARRPAGTKVTLASAFSALLAAEQAQPTAPVASHAPAIVDALVEDLVGRVMQRFTPEMVRAVVADTAERLIREEIEKMEIEKFKISPE
jgi:CheY-like chemotaxis protein